jgi:transcriptional regulator with XRE-family HTH domain
METALDDQLGRNLALNLKYLRSQRGVTQARLAKQAGLPRSTLATLELGDGNPTLAVLARLSLALQVSIEEILSSPRAQSQVFPKGSLPISKRSGGKAWVAKLLPDPVPGMEIDRIELAPGASFRGVPHRPGTREYLCCEKGRLTLWAASERIELGPGDVAAFQGDQRHSYMNEGQVNAVGFSVVAFVPIAVR